MKRRIARVCIMLLACVLLASCSSSKSNKHPFEKLQKNQTQDKIHSMLGEPGGHREGWVRDERILTDYYVYEFLGKTGRLELEYSFDEDSDEPLLEHAVYAYYYYAPFPQDGIVITDSEKDTASAYYQEIIDYFTEEYGAPREGFYEYEWRLSDGTVIGLSTLDLTLARLDGPIAVNYDFP